MIDEKDAEVEELKEMTTITHGLIAIDKRELEAVAETGDLNVLHFTGFWDRPKLADIIGLREELETDPEFGCTEIMEHVIIVEAPEEVLNYYKNKLLEAYNNRVN